MVQKQVHYPVESSLARKTGTIDAVIRGFFRDLSTLSQGKVICADCVVCRSGFWLKVDKTGLVKPMTQAAPELCTD